MDLFIRKIEIFRRKNADQPENKPQSGRCMGCEGARVRGENLFEKRFFPSRSLFHKLLDAIRRRLLEAIRANRQGGSLIMWEGGAA